MYNKNPPSNSSGEKEHNHEAEIPNSSLEDKVDHRQNIGSQVS
jgi:hypothetical protein